MVEGAPATDRSARRDRAKATRSQRSRRVATVMRNVANARATWLRGEMAAMGSARDR